MLKPAIASWKWWLGALVLAAVSVSAAQMGYTPASPCAAADTGALVPSADIYCMELSPRPDVPEAGGTVELGRARSPFDVALAPDGSQRYDLTIDLHHLPPVGTLGSYTSYVAWVAPPSLQPMRRLGVVRNGRTHVGEIDFDKFLVFVTAERSATGTTQQGMMVLRGLSPSVRMQQHSMDMPVGSASGTQGHAGHAMAQDTAANAPKWSMPPHRPSQRMIPMPGVDELVPPATPWLPGNGVDVRTLPEAKPRTLVRLNDGDSLDLTASLVRRTINGRQLVMYAYNGQYPGPLLQVREGATVHVRFRNAIDLPSAVHWHGVRLANASDGAVGVTQDEVKVGQTFQYTVFFRDAGIYWYHAHVREDIQQDLGLYGNILVRPARPDAFGPVHREETLMLDDLLLGEAGLVPYGTEYTTHALMGRFGNVLLVNGATDYRLAARPGEVVRFYLTNVSNTRTFNLGFPSARVKLVGADVGRYEQESWVSHVTIAPAQRYIVDVRFSVKGTYALVNRVQAIDHNVGNFFPELDTLGIVVVAGPSAAPNLDRPFARLRLNRDVVTDIDRYRQWFDKPPDKQLLLTLRLGQLPFGVMQMLKKDVAYAHPVELSGTMPMMDWLATTRDAAWVMRDPATGRENMDLGWSFRLGEIVKMRLANDRTSLHPMPHPIHLHGQRFLVLSQNGVPSTNLVWKDTVLLPVGTTADLLVEMSNPGKWMMHCHIAEHLMAGMMGVFVVE